ncbi:MAG: GspH/FimT family pseudopilin [Gammaproteobacteria bacterium]
MNEIKIDMKNRHTGFTIIELMMALMIGAILATMAVPSFIDLIRSNRVTTQTNDFISTLNYARSEAVKRGTGIIVCSSNDQASCTASAWQDGWIVQQASDGELLRASAALSGNSSLSNLDGNTSIQYTSRGLLNGNLATTFELCIYAGKPGRQIAISATGRPRSTEYLGC